VTPLRFGPPGRQLFGLFRPGASLAAPRADGRPHPGVLLCPPWGQEAVRSQRLFRALADRLARLGHPVLQFDYLGTGDADGDDTDGDLDTWQSDVLSAHTQLMRLTGDEHTVWIGLRLGATLAASASAKASVPPQCLLAWDPIDDGAAYLKDLRSTQAAYLQEAYGQRWAHASQLLDAQNIQVPEQAFGFALSPKLIADLTRLQAQDWATVNAKRVALLTHASHPGVTSLSAALAQAQVPTHCLITEEHINWASDEAMNTAIVPQGIMRQLTAQLTEHP
jgi:pimeloyl-ACP methyl ester carboxylesterase